MGLELIGRPTWLTSGGGFGIVRDGRRTMAPSPKSFCLAMGTASSEALRKDGRDLVAA